MCIYGIRDPNYSKHSISRISANESKPAWLPGCSLTSSPLTGTAPPLKLPSLTGPTTCCQATRPDRVITPRTSRNTQSLTTLTSFSLNPPNPNCSTRGYCSNKSAAFCEIRKKNSSGRVFSQGCTQYLKDMVADNDQQWIRGKVFGFSFVGTNRNLLPLWSSGVWSSVCITASTEAGGLYTVHFNGQIVLRTRNREDIFKTPQVYLLVTKGTAFKNRF